jgi:Ca-activated chloride channel homolog
LKKLISVILLLAIAAMVFGDSFIITHVDGRYVLFDQQVRAYGLLLDSRGRPIKDFDENNFTVSESWNGGESGPLEITSVTKGVNETQRLYVTLLVDNSGSMYYNANGSVKNSNDESIWRITAAKSAVENFIKLNTNKLHKLSVISFNSDIVEHNDFTNDQEELAASLDEIEKPTDEQAYTELYEAMYYAGQQMSDAPGRRIILVLSDGENVSKKNNPAITSRHTPEEVIDLYQQEGITCFTIGLSRGADEKSLQKFSTETGGIFTLEHNPNRLKSLYNAIHEQLANEFAITYKTPIKATDETKLQASYGRLKAERPYFSALLFGSPWEEFNWLFLLIIAGVIVLIILMLLSWKVRKKEKPSLQVLSGHKKTIALKDGSTQALSVGGVETRITAKDGQYTLVCKDATVAVNNKKTKTRALKSGDLIDVGGTQILFTAPEDD